NRSVSQQSFHDGPIAEVSVFKMKLADAAQGFECAGIAARQIIDHRDLVAVFKQSQDCVRSDVAGSAGYQHVHVDSCASMWRNSPMLSHSRSGCGWCVSRSIRSRKTAAAA